MTAVLLLAVLAHGCSRPPGPPNVLFIVWDTVRSDHLSLYGYERETTPFLDRWAQDARVFEDCVSPGVITLTSHGSLFTGLPSSEHGTDNGQKWLDDRHVTLAEHLKAVGYRTFLWSANPHVSAAGNFHQGFDLSLHPWDDEFRERAKNIVREKLVDGDVSSRLPQRVLKPQTFKWDIKASGKLAREVLLEWLGQTPSGDEDQRPYFAFLNYMEAHRPRIPPVRLRQRMLSDADVTQSFLIDQSWEAIWGFSFGLADYTEDELRIMTGVYDATLAELDELFSDLIGQLEAGGWLDNTIVVLTSDHGEHLGEHHLLDHQFSVYEPLTRVPLVVHYPERFEPGRDSRPVMSHDIFPTLLELAGLEAGNPRGTGGTSLFSPRPDRPRLTEYLVPFRTAFKSIAKIHPDFDRAPWDTRLHALTLGDQKLIRSKKEVALYDLEADPEESTDLTATNRQEARRLGEILDRQLAAQKPFKSGMAPPELSPEHARRLQALGYLGGSEDEPGEAPASEGSR